MQMYSDQNHCARTHGPESQPKLAQRYVNRPASVEYIINQYSALLTFLHMWFKFYQIISFVTMIKKQLAIQVSRNNGTIFYKIPGQYL